MKKTALTILSYLFCITVFAQETKPCLFIGLYDKNKRGICSDREMVHEEVEDYADYVIKRTQFDESHKNQNPNTRFINANESVIAYQYEKEIVGWKCNSNVIGIKTGKTLENCNKQLADQLAKNPKDFTTLPNTIFTWQGKGKTNGTAQYTKDFGGLNGKFTSGNTSTKNIIVAQLTNRTKDKLAYVSLKTDNGAETIEYIYPNEIRTKKYDTKNLEIKVIYLDSKKPKPTNGFIDSVKDAVRVRIIDENGKIRSMPGNSGGSGVRG